MVKCYTARTGTTDDFGIDGLQRVRDRIGGVEWAKPHANAEAAGAMGMRFMDGTERGTAMRGGNLFEQT